MCTEIEEFSILHRRVYVVIFWGHMTHTVRTVLRRDRSTVPYCNPHKNAAAAGQASPMTSMQEEGTENGAVPEESMDCDAESSEEEDWQVLVVKGAAQRPLQPPQDFIWDDRAIVDCFQCAIDSHQDETKQHEWKPPPVDENEKWNLKPIPLPGWAVDPLLQSDKEKKTT